MGILAPLGELTPAQWRAFIAAFLGWCLDAFDFFLVTFVLSAIADEFKLPIPKVAFAITIALMCRPLGALIFGVLADRYGRRGPLMASVLLYSIFELLSGFSPNFTVLIILRALYGVAMGGEWGVGAALALETLPPKARGVASGILQQGYATGYLIAALVFGGLFQYIGWRGMFFVGVAPALLVLFIRAGVKESPVWREGRSRHLGAFTELIASIKRAPLLFAYAILLMAAFNFMSHGSQDLYPTFLQKQHGFNPGNVRNVTVFMNIGAILGGTLVGAFSQRIGRRVAIAVCCVLGALLVPFWAGAQSAVLLAVSAFSLQFFVQGAWGVIPAHLNELSPPDVRGTFPGFTYQLGNLITAYAAQWEAAFATKSFPLPLPQGADYGRAMEIIMIGVFAVVFVLALIGHERRDVDFAALEPEPAAP
jgi:SHS family lactate transporter-like MFS transporter